MIKKKCKIQWISGNLKGIIMDEELYDPKRGQIVSPYGCSGKFKVIDVYGPIDMLMKKEEFFVGREYWHVGLCQSGIFDEQCRALENVNSDPTSVFISFDGDIKEVSLNLMRDFLI